MGAILVLEVRSLTLILALENARNQQAPRSNITMALVVLGVQSSAMSSRTVLVIQSAGTAIV